MIWLMNFSLFFFPFWFNFTNQPVWGLWFLIPVAFTYSLGDITYKKGCWFFG